MPPAAIAQVIDEVELALVVILIGRRVGADRRHTVDRDHRSKNAGDRRTRELAAQKAEAGLINNGWAQDRSELRCEGVVAIIEVVAGAAGAESPGGVELGWCDEVAVADIDGVGGIELIV